MVPLVGVPETIRLGLAPYREVFCRAEGFDHVGRYITGLLPVRIKRCKGSRWAGVGAGGAAAAGGPCTKGCRRPAGLPTSC